MTTNLRSTDFTATDGSAWPAFAEGGNWVTNTIDPGSLFSANPAFTVVTNNGQCQATRNASAGTSFGRALVDPSNVQPAALGWGIYQGAAVTSSSQPATDGFGFLFAQGTSDTTNTFLYARHGVTGSFGGWSLGTMVAGTMTDLITVGAPNSPNWTSSTIVVREAWLVSMPDNSVLLTARLYPLFSHPRYGPGQNFGFGDEVVATVRITDPTFSNAPGRLGLLASFNKVSVTTTLSIDVYSCATIDNTGLWRDWLEYVPNAPGRRNPSAIDVNWRRFVGPNNYQQAATTSVTAGPTYNVQIQPTVATTVATTGAVQNSVGMNRQAAVTASPAVQKQVGAIKTASVTTTATLRRALATTQTATVTCTTAITRACAATKTAAVTTSASVVRQVNKTFTANVVTTATVTALKVFLKTLTAVVTATPVLARRVGKQLAVSVSVTPTIRRALAATKSAAVALTATVAKRLPKTFTASVTTTGSMSHTSVVVVVVKALVRPLRAFAQNATRVADVLNARRSGRAQNPTRAADVQNPVRRSRAQKPTRDARDVE